MGAKDTVVNRSRQVRGKIKDIIGRATKNPTDACLGAP